MFLANFLYLPFLPAFCCWQCRLGIKTTFQLISILHSTFKHKTDCYGQAVLWQEKRCQYSARMFAVVLEEKGTVNITTRVSHVGTLWGRVFSRPAVEYAVRHNMFYVTQQVQVRWESAGFLPEIADACHDGMTYGIRRTGFEQKYVTWK